MTDPLSRLLDNPTCPEVVRRVLSTTYTTTVSSEENAARTLDMMRALHDDVRTFHPVPGSCDIVTGGFPCQDISCAGKRTGIEGERSGLWREFFRIICEVEPRFVFVENSPMLIHGGLGRVLGDLASVGFDAEWECIPASSVGAPHVRDRIWILAYPRRFVGVVQECGDDGHNVVLQQRSVGETQIGGDDRFLATLVPGVHQRTPEDWWRTQSRMDRSTHRDTYRMDRLRGLGNAQVPQCMAAAFTLLAERAGVT